ncbi:dihydrofolate reductase family protein, partial [Pseudomonas aeruginosa]
MKPHLTYYVAASLDGFIARPDGSVDWLDRFAEGGNDHGYKSFYQGIDGLLMGRGTYDIVRGFGDWPYPGKPCQVLTRNPQESAAEGVELRHVTPQEGLARLGEQGCRRIWLAGGGSLAGSCLAAGL